jgi:hypothetical protein
MLDGEDGAGAVPSPSGKSLSNTDKGDEMTTAVERKRKTALERLTELEDAHRQAAERAQGLGRQQFEAHKRLHGHLDERGLLHARTRLMEREPDQFHPDGSARQKNSAAGRLEAQINETPDPAPLAQRVEHAARLERQAKQALDRHVSEHLDEILDGLRAEAEARAGAVNATAAEFSAALDGYIGFHGRVAALVAVAGRDTRSVPGLDPAADYRRVAQEVELPAPIPEAS